MDAKLLEAAFLASPLATCLANVEDGTVLIVNPAWVDATGVSREAALAKGFVAFDTQLVLSIERAKESGSAAWGGALGSEPKRWLLQISALPEPHAHLSMLVMTPSDGSTDQSHINQVLQQQVQLHPAIERLARVGHWTNVEGSEELVWSPGLYEIAGLPLRGVIAREEGRSGIHPDDREPWLAARSALDGRDVEYRWTRPNGELRWLRTRMGRTDVVGRQSVAFGVVQDITDEREAKLALAKELGFINNIAAHVPGAIYRARRAPDGTNSVSFVSASAFEVLGVNAAEVMRDQRLFFSSIVPEDLPGLLALLDRTCDDLSTLRANFRADVPGRGRRWIQAEATTQREPDGSIVWHGFITDVTEHLVAARALERQHTMLQAVQKSQATFIEADDKRKAFDGLLASFLSVTDSEYGFVAEVLYNANGQPYLRMQAMTNIAWDDVTRQTVEANSERGVEFHNLKTLFGHALRTGETVISNAPATDPRAGGLPAGHPSLNSFLGLPIAMAGRLVAMVGLANRPEGFLASDEEFLQPLLGTVRELVMASRTRDERHRARMQFQATSALLAEKTAALQLTFDSIAQGLSVVGADGRVQFYNRRALELLELPDALMAGRPLHTDVVKFQTDRGDFGEDLALLNADLKPYVSKTEGVLAPARYVRRTASGRTLEVFTRVLADGGFVRTYTDVTSYFDAQEALREERQRLQWVLEATRPGIWEVNLVTGTTTYNERWAEMLGYTLAELKPTTLQTWERLLHPDDMSRAAENRDLHLSGETAYFECDVRMRHKNGHWLWVNNRGRVHRRDSDGRPLYMSGTLLDINDRVAAQEEVRSLNADLERRVAERTAELERSMKDMEAISYSIAHDLRAPLRSVNGFASLIADEESDHLSPQAKMMFERISRSSRNMGQMITDMLELLRVVRVDLDAVPVDMQQLAASVSEALSPSAPNALIGIKTLPRVMGDATLLRQVLVNLMDNALKYARHRQQPELVLGFDHQQRAFYLRDNGMGFDMARAGKLFGLFQRMHADSEVPGTGVGLAIVARIVERHGGRIWAEASPGKGATFWWTLPRA